MTVTLDGVPAPYACSQEPHPGVEFYGTDGGCAECGFTPTAVVAGCGHDPGSNWFDRTVCEEPCSKMHTRCRPCGAVLDGCVHEDTCRSCGKPPAECDADLLADPDLAESLAQMRRGETTLLVARPADADPDGDMYDCHGCGQPASRKANRCPNCEQVTERELADAPIGPHLLGPDLRRVYDRLHRVVHRHAFHDHDCQTTSCQAMHLVCSSELADVLAEAYARGRRDALADPGGTG